MAGVVAVESRGEESLVQAVRAGDARAWAELFDDNFQPLYRYALCRVHDHHAAEELASQVFEEAMRGVNGFRYRGVPLRAWLYRIAHNLTVDHLRRKSRQPASTLFELEANYDELQAAGVRTDFLRALRGLTDDQQQVVVLRFLQDLSIEECAAITGKSPGAVKMLQSRGLERLRSLLQGPEARQ
ncbi:MAG: sigma-70 family RNA polymerase sigma factor [Dehalococcoidia bacterium]|nr:sigma-70 family RNA polymerase sigma factor [Dehalococcoidia bacterium]